MACKREFCIFLNGTPTIIDGSEYNYTKDRHVYNKDKNEHIVQFQCQKSMKSHDGALKDDNVVIKVFARQKPTEPFRYLGTVQSRKIIEQRTEGADRLTMQFNIPNTETLIIPAPTTRGQGKYKIPVFNALNVEPKHKCYMHGIIEVFPKGLE